MSVESFDPSALPAPLNATTLARLLEAAQDLQEPRFGLRDDEVQRLAAVAAQQDAADWAAVAEPLSSAELEDLIRLFTLAEGVLPGVAGRSALTSDSARAGVAYARRVSGSVLASWIKENYRQPVSALRQSDGSVVTGGIGCATLAAESTAWE